MPGVDLDDIKCDEELPRRYTSRTCGEEAGKALATWARPSSYHAAASTSRSSAAA